MSVHQSFQAITHRRKDLENDKTGYVWLELKPHAHGPSLFVCYLYRNPAVTFEWHDSFVQMPDDVYKAKNRADVLILGDFNIDKLKPHSCCDSTLDLFGLCPAHYFTNTNNSHFDVTNRSYLYEQP